MYFSVEYGRTSGAQKGHFCIFSLQTRAVAGAYTIGLADGAAIFLLFKRRRQHFCAAETYLSKRQATLYCVHL